MLVVHRALEKSGITITPQLSPRVATTFSSAVGGQDAVLKADRRMVAENKLPPPYANPNACINMVGGKVSILTNATGPISAPVTACATGATSMIIGAMMLEQGRADVALCGAVDFAIVLSGGSASDHLTVEMSSDSVTYYELADYSAVAVTDSGGAQSYVIRGGLSGIPTKWIRFANYTGAALTVK